MVKMDAESFLRTRGSLKVKHRGPYGDGGIPRSVEVMLKQKDTSESSGWYPWREAILSHGPGSWTSLQKIAYALEQQAKDEGVELSEPILPILQEIQSDLPGVPKFFRKKKRIDSDEWCHWCGGKACMCGDASLAHTNKMFEEKDLDLQQKS